MEKLKNHHGKNSVLVVRPADAEETTVCWRMAMENVDTPTALIFSRQNIEMLPEGNDYNQATKGAYVVKGSDENYDVILLASGSEVSTLDVSRSTDAPPECMDSCTGLEYSLPRRVPNR